MEDHREASNGLWDHSHGVADPTLSTRVEGVRGRQVAVVPNVATARHACSQRNGTEIFRAERVGSRVRHKYIVIQEVVRGIELGLSQTRGQRIGIRRERITNRLLYCTK